MIESGKREKKKRSEVESVFEIQRKGAKAL